MYITFGIKQKMKTYSEYKDSGIEWIGKIPSHWEVKKNKFINLIYAGNSLNETEKLKFSVKGDSYYPYIATKDINYNNSKINYEVGINIPYNEKFKVAKKDSTLVCIEGGSAGKKIAFLKTDVCFVNKLASLKPKLDDSNLYNYFQIKSNHFNIQFNLKLNGLIGGVSLVELRNIKLIRPPIQEQEKIANYLDNKTQIIDKLIENTQNQVDKLKEYEQSLINKVVTKGLDENVEFKDSGIEWTGKIPKHWKVKKLKYIGETKNGISIAGEFFGSGHPFVSYGDVYNNYFLSNKVQGLVQSTEKDRELYSVKKGDIFFTRTSETVEEVGISSTCLTTIKEATFAGFLIRFRPKKNVININFGKYFFRNRQIREFFIKNLNLVTRASLSQDLLNQLKIILPQFQEQEEIGNYLYEKTQVIDKLIRNKQTQLNIYQELKKSVINDAVTGKIKVI